jgi:hypothetical protein
VQIFRTNAAPDNQGFTNWNSNALGNGNVGHYIAKSWTQLGGSMNAGKFLDFTKINQFFPEPVKGTLDFSHWWLTDSTIDSIGTGIVRGYLPGVLFPSSRPQFETWSKYSGTGSLAGREYLYITTSTNWVMWLEISNTW